MIGTWTKQQRILLVLLCILILTFHLIPLGMSVAFPPVLSDSLQGEVESILQKNSTLAYTHDIVDTHTSTLSKSPPAQRFVFDPNTLSEEGWQQLGVSSKVARTIQKYLSKKGHFYKKEDLKKIYTFPPALYEELAPYIRIQGANPSVAQKVLTPTTSHRIDINTDDAKAWEALRGIGEKKAARILKYKQLLGGFYDIGQLREVYGIEDTLYQAIAPYLTVSQTPVLQTISLNTAVFTDLSRHPYIGYEGAKQIMNYRQKNGAFKRIDELLTLGLMTDRQFQKLQPYLRL